MAANHHAGRAGMLADWFAGLVSGVVTLVYTVSCAVLIFSVNSPPSSTSV